MIKINKKKNKKTKTPTERIFQLLITRIEKENKRWASPVFVEILSKYIATHVF
jgi:hypothetical protein